MTPFGRFLTGIVAGAAATAAVLAALPVRTVPDPVAPAAADPVPTDAELRALAVQVAEAEARASLEAAPPPRATPSGGLAAEWVAALRAPAAGSRTPRSLAHVLRRAQFELQLAPEESLILPLRDQLAPAVLAAWDLPLSADQEAAFGALLVAEEEAWEERLRLRKRETPVARAAAALELAVRFDDWLRKILTPAQLAVLATPVPGRRPEDRRPPLGARRAPGGTAFDPRQDDAEIVLVGRWGARIGQTPGLHDAATEYVARLRDLGPAAIDETGTVPLAWGARRAAIAAEIQRRWIARVPGEPGVKRWFAEEVWSEE